MARLLPLLVVALLLWPATALAESPDQYRAALGETLQAAEEAEKALPANASLAEHQPLRAALQRLEAIEQVTADGGATVTVANGPLLKALRGSRDQGLRGLERLRALVAALDASTARADWASDGKARAALDKVLARSEFQPASPNPISQFLDDLRTRLFKWLEGLFPGFSLPDTPDVDLSRPLDVAFWVVAVVLVVFAIVFFGFIWLNTRSSMARYAATGGKARREGEDARAARLAAEAAASAGDYRLAIHFLYQWAMLHFDEQARWRYDRSLTNREHLRVLPVSGEAAELSRQAVDAFDRIWYGHADCTADDYGQFRHTIERIVEAAP